MPFQRHRPYVTLTARHALGITILTWVASADVKAKLEILLGVCFDNHFGMYLRNTQSEEAMRKIM